MFEWLDSHPKTVKTVAFSLILVLSVFAGKIIKSDYEYYKKLDEISERNREFRQENAEAYRLTIKRKMEELQEREKEQMEKLKKFLEEYRKQAVGERTA